jgi:hypothetical protein
VVRQFHDGAEAVSLERVVALPFQPTMSTKLVILTDEGVTPELEVIGLTMRAAPDRAGVSRPPSTHSHRANPSRFRLQGALCAARERLFPALRSPRCAGDDAGGRIGSR